VPIKLIEQYGKMVNTPLFDNEPIPGG
jgi:hypothetical protein